MIAENKNWWNRLFGKRDEPAQTRQRMQVISPVNDYRMSRESRFNRRRTGLAPNMGGSADWHYRNTRTFYNNMEKARDMDRNDIIAGQLLDRVSVNIIQEGFGFDPKTGDKGLDAALKARWHEESNDPFLMDIAGEMSFHDFEYVAMRSMFRDGDCFMLGTKDGPLQFFEAHTVQAENEAEDIVMGVKINKYRAKVGIFVQLDETDYRSTAKLPEQRIGWRDANGLQQVFHVYNPKRTTLTRGVSAFAPVFEASGLLEDINFAKLMQQITVSSYAVFREYAAGTDLSATVHGSRQEQGPLGVQDLIDEEPGKVVTGDPGEKLTGFSPNVPNAEYFDQVNLITQLISTAFGVPLMVLLLDASQTNFTGWRGALDEARKGYRFHQRNLVKRFHTPQMLWRIQNVWMPQDPAMRKAAKLDGVDILKHNWNPPTWQYIEPMKDAQADSFRLRNGLISPRRLHAERGRDYEDVLNETIEDNATAIRKAQQAAESLSEELGIEVNYNQLIATPTPEGVTISLSANQQDPAGTGTVPAAPPTV